MRGTLLFFNGFFLALLVFIGSLSPLHAQVWAQDSSALLGILNQNCAGCGLAAANFPNNWNAPRPVRNWYGITVENGRVTSIELNGLGLIGDLASLDALDSLKTLDIQANHIESLPDLDHNLILKELNCGENRISSLPTTLSACTQLEHLSCFTNELTALPDLSPLTQLDFLSCSQNFLPFPALLPLMNRGISQNYYVPQQPFSIESLDSIPFLSGNQHTLHTGNMGTSQSQYLWLIDNLSSPNDTNSTITCDAASGPGSYFALITDPQVPNLTLRTVPIYLEPGPGVRSADTDNNGIWNMLDMVAIGLNYGDTGTVRINGADTLEQPSFAWLDANGNPRTFLMDSVPYNLKFADADGNGILNNEDKFPIDSFYSQPLMLSAYLRNAIQPQFNLTATPMQGSIQLVTDPISGDTLIEVPYRIEIGDLPNGISSIDLRGVVFTRAVTEPGNLYQVRNIRADFMTSDFIPQGKHAFWLQKYHRNISILPADSNFACLDTLSTHPLDVGVFHTDSAVTLVRSNCIINCIVTLEDVYRPSNQTGLTYDSIPLMLSTINAVVYADSNGQTVPIAGECTTDTTYLDIQTLLDDWNGPVLYQPETTLLDSTVPAPELHLFPNPVTAGEWVTLEVPLASAGPIFLSLFSSTGQNTQEVDTHLSLNEATEGKKGNNHIQISTAGLSSGFYFLKVNCPGNPDSTTMLKLIIKK